MSAAQFRKVFSKATRYNTRCLVILAVPNGLARGRLGMAISKKIDKRAVGRNRIKRQIRESFRQHKAILQGLDIVVLGRHGLSTTPNNKLRTLLDNSWHKVAKQCAKSS